MSSSTSTSRKRSREAASHLTSSAPPQSKRVTRSTKHIPNSQPSNPLLTAPSQADVWSQPHDFEPIIMESAFLESLKNRHEDLKVSFRKGWLAQLSHAIKKGNSEGIRASVNTINKWFELYPKSDDFFDQDAVACIRESWQELVAEIYKPSSPSSFCRGEWVGQQKRPAFINCLRPRERSGLPLKLLHPMFAKFSALIEGDPNYSDPKFILAEQVATELCHEMPQNFGSEDFRLKKFSSIVLPLFDEIGTLDRTAIGACQADFGLKIRGIGLVLVGEGRNEPGGGAGDPYMQVAASYDAHARRRSNATNGCPCFVISVDGPNILFGGGFRDDKVSVVEPLSGWKPLPSATARCARIYNTFLSSDTNEPVPLKFIEPFKSPWRCGNGLYDLLFRASVGSESSVLVKVPVGSAYGREAHILAASAGYAPTLLGKADIPGAPAIYVMELLRKEEGWFHLVKMELPEHITQQQKETLRRRGELLLTFLSTNRLVHGDLRGYNIMCRLDDDVHLRVLDWDWAGKQGVARYPATLNTNLPYQVRTAVIPRLDDHDRNCRCVLKWFDGPDARYDPNNERADEDVD
ncbi:hypothetical protein FRB99_006303 [Tulasnella sp. 403]|nr:hypothetical protein FRB99_006303 [Tulasnella sp. 403]